MNRCTRFRWLFTVILVVLAGCSRNTSPPGPVNPPFTETQTLGIDLMKALSKDPRLARSSISVGTSSNTVTLDGKVPSASAKAVALQIANSRAPGYEILNRLVVEADAAPANQAKPK